MHAKYTEVQKETGDGKYQEQRKRGDGESVVAKRRASPPSITSVNPAAIASQNASRGCPCKMPAAMNGVSKIRDAVTKFGSRLSNLNCLLNPLA